MEPGLDSLMRMAQSVALFRSMYIKHSRSEAGGSGSWRFLVMIGKYDDGRGVRPAELAAYFHCSKAYVSKMVKELAAEGLVVERPDASDARSHLLQCTEQGNIILQEIMTEYLAVTKKLRDGLGERRSRMLVELLEESIAILERD